MSSNSKTLEEQYSLLFEQIKGLLNPSDPLVTNLSNVTAALNQTFEKISWVGFYLNKNETLFLGPFQGKVACTRINFGNGVCGTAALSKETQVVQNVHNFPRHIACDVESNSEIVVPLIQNLNVVAVLDLDSRSYSAFDETDKTWLEKICELIVNQIKFNTEVLSN